MCHYKLDIHISISEVLKGTQPHHLPPGLVLWTPHPKPLSRPPPEEAAILTCELYFHSFILSVPTICVLLSKPLFLNFVHTELHYVNSLFLPHTCSQNNMFSGVMKCLQKNYWSVFRKHTDRFCLPGSATCLLSVWLFFPPLVKLQQVIIWAPHVQSRKSLHVSFCSQRLPGPETWWVLSEWRNH